MPVVNVAAWNVGGLLYSGAGLAHLAASQELDVILLQELVVGAGCDDVFVTTSEAWQAICPPECFSPFHPNRLFWVLRCHRSQSFLAGHYQTSTRPHHIVTRSHPFRPKKPTTSSPIHKCICPRRIPPSYSVLSERHSDFLADEDAIAVSYGLPSVSASASATHVIKAVRSHWIAKRCTSA